MPRRKKVISKSRRKKRRRNVIHTPNQGLIIAPRQIVKFRYNSQVQIDATSVAAAVFTIRANDLYDPEASGVGHQPLGFDEWMQFYDHFTVLGAKITATFIPTDASNTLTPQWVGIQTSAGTSPLTYNAQSFLEQKYVAKKMLGLPTARGPTSVTTQVSVKKFLGVKDLIDEDNNAGTRSASPFEGVFFHVFSCPYSSFYNPSIVNVSITVEYIAMLHEVRQLIQS